MKRTLIVLLIAVGVLGICILLTLFPMELNLLKWLNSFMPYHIGRLAISNNIFESAGMVIAVVALIWLIYRLDIFHDEDVPDLPERVSTFANFNDWCMSIFWPFWQCFIGLLSFCGIAGFVLTVMPFVFTWSFDFSIGKPYLVQIFTGIAPTGFILTGMYLAIMVSVNLLTVTMPKWEYKV